MNTDRIISQIRQAKSNIKLALAWFTDYLLISELENCVKKGISVEIILSGSEWNLLRYEEFKQLENLGAIINKFGPHDFTANNFMHHKFMIIDNSFCAHGSRNWTFNANSNKEYWQELTSDSKILNELNYEFDEMKKNLNPLLIEYHDDNLNAIIQKLSILEKNNIAPLKFHSFIGKSSVNSNNITHEDIKSFIAQVKEDIIYEEKVQEVKKDVPPQNEYGL